MFERFTEKAIKAVMQAHMICNKYHQPIITPQILVFGCLIEQGKMTLDDDVLQTTFGTPVEIPFSPAAKAILSGTLEMCQREGLNAVGIKELLRGADALPQPPQT